MLIKALLIIANNWKQFKCLSACEWIDILWYIQHENTEYYSALKAVLLTRATVHHG